MILNRNSKFNKSPDINNYLASKASFDELYEKLFFNDVRNHNKYKQHNKVSKMLESIGITQAFLDEIL